MALLALAGAIGENLYLDHRDIEARERERLAIQARVIDDNLSRQLAATNLGLASIRGDLPFILSQRDDGALLKRRLQAMRQAAPGMRAVTLFDRSGTLTARSPDEFVGQNFSNREYFKVAHRDGNPDTLYVSPPFLADTREYVVNVVRVLLNDKGDFDGIVLASLDPGYFSILLASVSYAPDMWTSLIHGDGKLFLRIPAAPGAEGMDVAKPGSFFTRYLETGLAAAVMTGKANTTGQESLVALRTIRPADVAMDKPLILAVGRNLANIFADWRQEAFRQIGFSALLAVMATVGLYIYQRRRHAFDLLLAEQEADRRQADRNMRIAAVAFESHEAMFVTDANERILQVNQAFSELTGYTAEEVIGQTPSLLKSVDSDPELYRDMWATIHRTGRWQGEIWDRRKDGSEFLNWLTISAVKGEDGTVTHYVGAKTDITERKRSEDEIREKNKDLERFAYVLAHHLQEPVRMQLIYASRLDKLLESDQLTPEVVLALGYVKRGAERLRALLRDVRRYLEPASPPSHQPGGGSSERALATALEMLAEKIAETKAEIHSTELPDVMLTQSLLVEVFTALIDNCLSYGRAAIAPVVSISARRQGGDVVILIDDNGIGIPEVYRDRVFNVFEQLDAANAQSGTGIGLALAKKIVESINGKIWIETADLGGTRVLFSLPQSKG